MSRREIQGRRACLYLLPDWGEETVPLSAMSYVCWLRKWLCEKVACQRTKGVIRSKRRLALLVDILVRNALSGIGRECTGLLGFCQAPGDRTLLREGLMGAVTCDNARLGHLQRSCHLRV